ncbi:hypothetical protein CKA32_004262 [Geitlerinema sp. FC II]|nr:hypothetical protein CKA32_004262 [Geitlerinema sp. FC II]
MGVHSSYRGAMDNILAVIRDRSLKSRSDRVFSRAIASI